MKQRKPNAAVKHSARRSMHGFTMVELATVSALVGVLMAIGFSYYGQLRRSSDVRNAFRELDTALSVARLTAISSGSPVVFLLRPVDGETPTALEFVSFVDVGGDFDPAAPSADPDEDDELIERRTLPAGLSFVDLGSKALAGKLPQPFENVPAATPCTFCGGERHHAVVVFRSDGTARLGPAPRDHPVGGSVTLALYTNEKTALEDESGGYGALDIVSLVILSRTGLAYPFERSLP